MPESGYYEKRPRPEHRKFLLDHLGSRPTVSSVKVIDDFKMEVRRVTQSTIKVYLTNMYQLGLADVVEILGKAPDTTCIVSTMDYNHFSDEAKEYAKERNVGLFRARDFLGAVYYDGKKFLEYLSPREREERARRAGS
ncbi:hypothetical protein [Amycolatopsis echigonensis]|uniref:Uncharacterized protein n=1 Tax=Amycolatopsis echigonensis TaxID=2576905 RepID=A0A8E1VUZ3_9PSEU|nr:hypothetical protein [Amycolatopsis echigonensis]MBB2498803.1 hypothetical protein [Amycolatopsis echigonensis]